MNNRYARPLKVGLFIGLFEGFMGGRTARWTDILAMARRAQEATFDSIWVPDHFLMRVGDEHFGVWEGTSMAAALAAATSQIELGTLVMCAGFRNPALIAKIADTVDEISGGRFILGLGAGSYPPEFRTFGYPTDHAYSRFEEAIQIIYGLLRKGQVDFSGVYHQARECELRPRGPRPGGPPIMIGTRGARMLRLTARYADLWNAFLVIFNSCPEDLAQSTALLDAACKAEGRDALSLGRTACIQWRPLGQGDAAPLWVRSQFGQPLTGEPDEVAEVFRQFAIAGVSELQVAVFPNSLAGIEAFHPVLEALDRTG
jgi:alkanesulfonate monooxygenase SsuD/methylene tetrahydromethanopterin reductase-like flavin-dependent oxidoreductase (luciferase family)